MQAVTDADALVRAQLAGDQETAARILAETPSHPALAATLACMLTLVLRELPVPLREKFLTVARRHMQDNALDIEPHAPPDVQL